MCLHPHTRVSVGVAPNNVYEIPHLLEELLHTSPEPKADFENGQNVHPDGQSRSLAGVSLRTA